MYDSIGTTTYCMIICMKSRLMSFSYDSVTEGCISVKCQLLTVNFVGFGCQPGFRLHTSRQSFEPSYTQIQALLVFFLSFALASQPFQINIFNSSILRVIHILSHILYIFYTTYMRRLHRHIFKIEWKSHYNHFFTKIQANYFFYIPVRTTFYFL